MLGDFRITSHVNPNKKKKESGRDKGKLARLGIYLQDLVAPMEKKSSLLLVMQLKNGFRHDEEAYVAALIEIKLDLV
ncbi:UNVERIFIED_CONTAM: hypothetical protein Sindi_2869400 [Sesamum indicum]